MAFIVVYDACVLYPAPLGLLNLHEAAVPRIVVEQTADLKNPPLTVEDVLQALEQNGLARSVAELRAMFHTSG